MPWRAGQLAVFVLWLFGVPMLAAGLALDLNPLAAGGAWCLLAATVLDAMNVARILRYAFRRATT
jgi:hypothetical protein